MDRKKFDELMAKSEPLQETVSIPFKDLEELERLAKQNQENFGGDPQFGFDVVEVQRVGLQPGDVLMVTVKNDDLSQESVDSLRYQLQQVFPDNKVFVFAMGTSDDVQLTVVNDQKPLAIQSDPGYCGDCDCGKKEIVESDDEHMKNLAKQAGDPA